MPLFQVDIKTAKGLRALLTTNELKISEAYIYGDIDLNGTVDMLQLLEIKNLLHCRVFKQDFLEYKHPTGEQYDALFSLGTLEHLPNYQRALKKCAEMLKPGGYAYFDASASVPSQNIHSAFIERHIFPGNHQLLDIFRFIDAVKSSAFELMFVQNDTHNYYLTLKAWGQNLDAHKEEIIGRW